MKTSPTETARLEAYLLGTTDPAQRLADEARTQVDPEWRAKARWQRLTYALVRRYGRRQRRAELESIYR
ncbi:MAG: hypothetical protein WBA12_00210, partial [Catalinimonas sp.]